MPQNAKWRREQRTEEAVQRQEVRVQRTHKQQLARLDEILGDGVGAVKERARLQKKISDEQEKAKLAKKAKKTEDTTESV